MSELIAAVATAAGAGGIGIVRLSGEGAITCASAVFFPGNGQRLVALANRQLCFGFVRDERGQKLDEGLCFVSRAPHSYTGEETAEIQCHGSPFLLQQLLVLLCRHGARVARPGEFTKRAFLNGKLDLLQAEAVADLIEAETMPALRHAAGQLSGALSARVTEIYEALLTLPAHFYAVLDYPDEDIDPFREETIRTQLTESRAALTTLLSGYQRGRQLNRGIPCALLGRPNVGKSSLLNALLGYERAIVTDKPGTTRDTVEERVQLGGQSFRLMDTAGLRRSEDEAEQLGVLRTKEAVKQASLCLLLLDGSVPLTSEDADVISLAKTLPLCICVLTKADLAQTLQPEELPFTDCVRVSAQTGEGLSALEERIHLYFGETTDVGEQVYLTSARQYDAARRALEALERAEGGLLGAVPPDLLLIDVEEALAALGELQGREIRADITETLFLRFCVGK